MIHFPACKMCRLPLITLDIKGWGGRPVKTRNVGNDYFVNIGTVTLFGRTTSVNLIFDDYIVLDDLQTVLKVTNHNDGTYQFHMTTGILSACQFVTPMQCQTGRKIFHSKEGENDGSIACEPIRPGMNVQLHKTGNDNDERNVQFTQVQEVKEGTMLTFMLPQNNNIRYTIDMYLGVFVSDAVPEKDEIISHAFLSEMTTCGINMCQAVYLQEYLVLSMEMTKRIQDILGEKSSSTHPRDFFNVLRDPVHARYCYYRSTRSDENLMPENVYTKFYMALFKHLYAYKHQDEIKEMVFFFSHASMAFDGTNAVVKTLKDEIRTHIANDPNMIPIAFTSSKLLYVIFEVAKITISRQYIEYANIFTYITIKQSGALSVWGPFPSFVTVPTAYLTGTVILISTTTVVFTLLLIYLLIHEQRQNAKMKEERRVFFDHINDGKTVKLIRRQEKTILTLVQ